MEAWHLACSESISLKPTSLFRSLECDGYLVLALVMLGMNAMADQSANQSSTRTDMWNNEPSDSSIHLIPTIGVAMMGIKSDSGNSDLDAGLSVGGLADFGSGMFTLETGLLYNQFGGKNSLVQVNLNYLSVPVAGKFNFMGNPDKTAFLKLGVLPSFLMSQSASLAGQSFSGSDVGAKSFDLPLIVGVGGAIPVARNMSIVIEADYLRGLMNINGDGDGTARNEGFMIGTGISIGL